ncbi:SH3 domain-containing C40 family peptidase [Sulfurimonas sp. C5]|uniref:SH3 domain-containing C40 family peptidase n=1 Tax=Sulfurimonas sp. C5 TaxID=3036947 RepID=UPI002457C38E|nr:SH3 domain-containing C40 family peptidase [Sulfurimonas sp. C5]MDH4943878.1 SH3 domain-containing protein [Sulfurimonas sp. C5]
MKYSYLLSLLLLFNACSHKETVPKKEVIVEQEYVEDLVKIPQDPGFYASNINDKYIGHIETFADKYFRPWNIKKISINKEQASWAYVYDNNNSYTYTLQPIKEDFFTDIKENANLEEFATLNQQGLSLKLLDMRALPTDKPIFLDPSKAGEGYPFDYLQNTSLAPNKPLLISHYSKDKKWAFIECSFGFGWVKAKDIVTLDKEYTTLWKEAQQIFLTKDNQPIYDQEGNYLFDSRIGMALALIDEDADAYTVLTVSKNKENKALFLKSKISKTIAHKGLLEFNSINIVQLLHEIQNGKYGWGGIYGQRDCSSTLRDFYTPFGFWLPRNSSVQSHIGNVVDLEEFSNEQKEEAIKAQAIPFKTLVYKKGHIGLYVGIYENNPIIFQNVWGVKTKKDNVEGRFIIAKPIFSTLEAGKNLPEFDSNASMLTQLKSINTIIE